jgi:trimeric autotransporter adhesin
MNMQTRYLAAPLFYLGLSTLLVVGSCSTKHLVSIAVTPQDASVAQVGQTTQFTAMGTTNHVNVPPEDLTSTVTWTSSTPSVATITSSGLATATGCGSATISAQDGGVTGNTSLTVSCTTGGSGTLQSINLSPTGPTIPAVGQTTQFIALGEYVTPSSTVDLTTTATWSSSNVAIASVTSSGLATAIACGTTTITAEYQGVLSQTQLTVSCTQSNPVLQSISLYPASPSIQQIGQTTQFIALGAYTPASNDNVLTNVATWASSDASIATVSGAGLATAVSCGTTTITATYQGVVGQTQLTVSCTVGQPPVLTSISLFPSSPIISELGQTTQFIALAVYSPPSSNNVLTGVATWASSNTSIATVSNAGLATAVACGTTTITAEYQGVIGQTLLTTQCTGNQPLQSIEVLPSDPTIPQLGQTTQFLALGTLVGGGQEDLTSSAIWSSSNTQVATVIGGGTATAVSCGTSTISAQFQPNGGSPIVGTTLLTVSCNPITSIELLITKKGNNGTVTSVPLGIDCGAVCGGLFNEGTGFVLTAAPAATWTGCDQIIGGACYFTLVPDVAGGTQKVVTATF